MIISDATASARSSMPSIARRTLKSFWKKMIPVPHFFNKGLADFVVGGDGWGKVQQWGALLGGDC